MSLTALSFVFVGACLFLSVAAVAQGLSPGQTTVNPSAAPSNIGNPSSIVPGAAASDIGRPSSIVPGAAASDVGVRASRAPSTVTPERSWPAPPVQARREGRTTKKAAKAARRGEQVEMTRPFEALAGAQRDRIDLERRMAEHRAKQLQAQREQKAKEAAETKRAAAEKKREAAAKRAGGSDAKGSPARSQIPDPSGVEQVKP